MTPIQTDRHSSRPGAPSDSQFDAIADMFLGGGERREADDRLTPAAVCSETELLIPGHLPVLSGAWVVQYASRLARSGGIPVALAQLGAERTSVQILWPAEPESRPEKADDLRRAVHDANRAGARWLIATDEVSMMSALGDDRVSSACLLTAPNEAATVAAYQTIKSVAQELSRAGRSDGFLLRVAFAGASEDDGERALERIDRAAGVFIRRRIELAATIARIASITATAVYESDERTDVVDVLDLIEESPVAGEASEPRRVMSAGRSFDPVMEREEPAVRMSPAERSPESPREAAGGTLAGLVRDMTLRATAMRCPDAPEIEVAVDGDGVLHVLADAGNDSMERALKGLWVVQGWLARQSSLVNMALRRDPTMRVVSRVHLFVREARSARSLLDSAVQVRLVRTEHAHGHSFTFCELLN
ncbi:MAG: hypothetical protein H6812_08045 [Phycisphaeraceae bacterium]|nr:hypothetical protein [Phycisphaerales bacterium]MCB9843196.1 hypothetical protein [Phycisphaeraceae bacterium]